MSLINSILGQRLILVMIGIALFIFLVAVGINFFVMMRASLKRRAKRRKTEQARKLSLRRARARARAAQLAALEAERNVPTLPTLAEELGENPEEEPAEIDAFALSGADVAPPIMAASALPTADASAPQILPTLQTQVMGAPLSERDSSDKSAEIQSMLADVFSDVESDGRYDLLLGDSEAIQLHDLLEQLNNVARQLGVETVDPPQLQEKTSRAS
jgi:type II secretory pathway pseudopilin PulG